MAKYIWGAVVVYSVVGCSSTSNSRKPTGGAGGAANTIADGGTGGAAAGGTSPASTLPPGGSCGPSIADLPADGYGSNGLAVVGTDVFVVTRGATGHRIISLVDNGALTQVADVPSDNELIQTQAPGFYADANAFYIDAVNGDNRPLYRVDRRAGTQTVLDQISADNGRLHPLFVADDQYLYYNATANFDYLTRVAKSGATPPEVLQEGVFSTSGGLDQALAMDATNVYYVGGGDGNTADFGLNIGQKTPPSDLNERADYRNLAAPLCKYDPWYLAVDSGNAYVGCLNADQSQGYIYSFGPGATGSDVTGTVLASDPDLNRQVFAVANGNLYFEATDGGRHFVFKRPVGGGQATEILQAEAVDHMVVSGATLYLTSGCGVQKVAL